MTFEAHQSTPTSHEDRIRRMKLTPHLIGNPLNAPQQQQTEQTKCPRFGSSGNERKANEGMTARYLGYDFAPYMQISAITNCYLFIALTAFTKGLMICCSANAPQPQERKSQ